MFNLSIVPVVLQQWLTDLLGNIHAFVNIIWYTQACIYIYLYLVLFLSWYQSNTNVQKM